MIKDKISCELKYRILVANLASRDDGLERSFPICIEKDGKLHPTVTTGVGELGRAAVIGKCSGKRQGTYHNHPFAKQSITDTRNVEGWTPSKEEALEYLSRTRSKKILDYFLPTNNDLATEIVNKFENKSNGTTCIGNDAKLNIVDCWTINKKIDSETYDRAIESRLHREDVGDWAKAPFEREIIDLRKIECKEYIKSLHEEHLKKKGQFLM